MMVTAFALVGRAVTCASEIMIDNVDSRTQQQSPVERVGGAVDTRTQPANTAKSDLYGVQSSRPVMLAPIWDAIPATLRALPQWVAWELRWREENASWAKVPIDVRGVSVDKGYTKAKSDKPATWTTLDRVRAAWGRTYGTFTPANPDGPGFVFRAEGNLVGVDGDKCRDRSTGEITEFGRSLMARFPGYWEVSPSGTGIKGIFFGQLPEGKGRKIDFPEGHGVELYDRGRYFAVTGRRVEGAAEDVTSCVAQLPAYLAELDTIKAGQRQEKDRVRAERSPRPVFVPPADRTYDLDEKLRRARLYISHRPGAVAYQGGDNHTFGTACELVIGFDISPSQALPLLQEWNETCSPPWPDDWLWRKLTEADKQPGPRGGILHTVRPGRQRPLGYEGMSPAEIDELIGGMGRKIEPTAPPAESVPAGPLADLGQSLGTGILAAQPTTPLAEPEDCALFAVQDVEDDISLSRMTCPNLRPVLMSKDDRPFVCDRRCGNGSDCRPCLCYRLFDRTREGHAYLIRTSVTASDADPANAPRVVMAAIVDASVAPGTTRWGTLTNAVRDHGGERASLLTDDATGTAERLGRDPSVSRFFLSENKVEEESGNARLWLISLPAGSPDSLRLAGAVFTRVPVANAIRAWYHAVKTVPAAPAGDSSSRFKPHHKSAGWGDKPTAEPTTVKALRPSKFGVARTRKILEQLNVEAYSVQFDRRHGSDPGVGWSLSGARSLAMEVWLGGVDAPFVPTVSRVVELARHWLAIIPAGLGTGYRVMKVLAEHVWTCSLYDITAQLRQADEQDRAEEAAFTEASTYLAGLRETYRGRHHELTGLLAELLA